MNIKEKLWERKKLLDQFTPREQVIIAKIVKISVDVAKEQINP